MPVEGRGLSSGQTQRRSEGQEIGQPINSEKCSEAAECVTREAKTEAGYRFYALYDKIYREDILAHAYAQCRTNQGAPGVDGQDFADIEKYGVERWLGELALALREGELPTGSDQTSVYPESQWQTQAVGHLDSA